MLSLLQNLRTILPKDRKGKKVDFYPYLITEIKLSKEELVGENPTISRGLKVDFSKFGEIEEVELSRINKIFGANLHRNWVPRLLPFGFERL